MATVKENTKSKKDNKKSKGYNADSITVITDDIARLRERFESYIGYYGTMAFLHMIKEVLQNAIDEAGEKESPCDEIFIDYNEKEKTVRIKDNGVFTPACLVMSKIVPF